MILTFCTFASGNLSNSSNDSNIDLSNYGMKMHHFENDTLETKFFNAIFQPNQTVFTSAECRDICFNHTIVETQSNFNYFIYAVVAAVLFSSLSMIGFFIKNEKLALYSLICSLTAYLIGAMVLVL